MFITSYSRWLAQLSLSVTLLFSHPLYAAAELHVLFHMGLGAEGQFFIGGTLENRGDQDVHQGFIVVTPLSEDCYPQQPLLWPLATIAAKQKSEFRIPINGKLYGYKVDTVYGVDSFGNGIKVVDETAKILAARQPDYIKQCQAIRADKQK